MSFKLPTVETSRTPAHPSRLAAGAATCLLLLAACGQGAGPAQGDKGAPDEAARAAQLAERERALAEREAAVAAREAEDAAKAKAAAETEAAAKGEAEAAAKAEAARARSAAAAAQAKAARDKAAAEQKRVAAERAAAEGKAQREAEKRREAEAARAAAARPIEVPAGTRLAIALKQGLSSKTAKVGERFEAVLTEDVKGADGRVAVPAGATVAGTVTNVVSGSREIGATPAIGLRFEYLVTADGKRIPISGELDEQGKSERGRDTAKILGGVAAGAIIGNQAKRNDSGRVIGGILGGAIGAIAAKNTGTEVALGDGAPLTIALGEPITVKPAQR